MRSILFSVIGMAVLMGFSQTEGLACTCGSSGGNLTIKQQVKEAQKQSRAVFVGKVMQVLQQPDSSDVVVRFRVEKSWKGNLPREVIVVTGQGGGDCGYRFEVGGKYLVYAYGPNETSLGTNICQRTAALSEARADIKHLGKSKTLNKR
jgi:hypothetical protein